MKAQVFLVISTLVLMTFITQYDPTNTIVNSPKMIGQVSAPDFQPSSLELYNVDIFRESPYEMVRANSNYDFILYEVVSRYATYEDTINLKSQLEQHIASQGCNKEIKLMILNPDDYEQVISIY